MPSRLALVVIFVICGGIPVTQADGSVRRSGSDLASLLVIPRQYHDPGIAVSKWLSPAVSHRIGLAIGGSFRRSMGKDFQVYRRLELSLGLFRQIEGAQYQPDSEEPKRRLMLLVGLGLGAGYVVFFAAWIWATRLRSRPPRH
jgi:hypothetical protein